MIAKLTITKTLVLVVFLMTFSHLTSQNDSTSVSKSLKYLDFYNLRGSNTFKAGIGTSVMNGDLEKPEFEIYFTAGYKRYITPHINVNISYHKFNLAYKDVFNQGFMSFDLNLEYLMVPHKRFSPFVFFGAGSHASNYFDETAGKIQGGAGIEYIVTDGLGINLFADYNYVFSDTIDGLEFGSSDDTYYRLGLGLNLYFGGKRKKEKLMGDQKTVINTNLLDPDDSSRIVK